MNNQNGGGAVPTEARRAYTEAQIKELEQHIQTVCQIGNGHVTVRIRHGKLQLFDVGFTTEPDSRLEISNN